MDHRKKKLIADDKKYIWHPFTPMADWVNDELGEPLVIVRGKGNYLYDFDGKKYLDGVSSLWVNVHGHQKKEIDAAIKKQLGAIAHSTFLGLTHEPAIRLARKLVEITPPGLTRVFYSDNGSTSVEIALKMAYQYWQQTACTTKKSTFLSLRNAYHGDTIGSVSVGGMDVFHAAFRPLLFAAHFAPSPYCYRCSHRHAPSSVFSDTHQTFNSHCRLMQCQGQCIESVAQILKRNHADIAATVIEPMVQGAAGMITMPPQYVKQVEQLCRKYDVLMICDEVATGFGRTGKMFAVEHENVRPDILCLSKGITGGYLPLAATLVTEKIYRAFLGKVEECKTFFHGHSYTANPLACAAAIANLELFKKENTIRRLPAKIEFLRRELASLTNLPCVGDIRQRGLMVGIELVRRKKTLEEFPAHKKIGARVCAACRKHGILVRPLGNTIVIMPPLSITCAELSKLVGVIRYIIAPHRQSRGKYI
ncbi:MAG: adenosylmethionine--8-amino-7-oxononanoate transaminase [Endomicrobiales bacterium]|jgi:adenosylmethionine-8-amino-7-oxononanoate transaminase